MNKLIKFNGSLIFYLAIVLVLLSTLVACASTPAPTPSASAAAPPPSTSSASSISPSSPTATPVKYTINTMTSATLGEYLVDGKGMTLYYTMHDSPGVSNVPDNLLTTWIPFYAANILVPPSLNASDFSTITRSNGQKLTTYQGYPLYYYSGDTAPGDTKGQGIGGVWYVITPGNFPPTPSPSG